MSKTYKFGLAGLSVFCVFVFNTSQALSDDYQASGSEPRTENGVFLDHPAIAAQGGVGNYVTPTDESTVVRTDPNISRTPEQAGQFLDHDTVAKIGGVGNYITPAELKSYDMKLAQQQKLRDQLSVSSFSIIQPSSYQATNQLKDEGLVFFNPDRAELDQRGKVEIAGIAEELQRDQKATVEVDGYSDSVGPADLNQDLASARAVSVRNELLKDGADSSQIRMRAYGENQPLAANDTEAGRQLNRRAELYVQDVSTG